MGIRVLAEGGIIAPVLLCDTCGERVTADRPAIVVNNWTSGDLRFVHKVPRCDRAEELRAAGFDGWDDLDVWLWYLKENAGVKFSPRVRERARTLSGVGW